MDEILEMVYGFCRKVRFTKYEGKTFVAQEPEYIAIVYNIFICVFWKYDAVIKVDKGKLWLEHQ